MAWLIKPDVLHSLREAARVLGPGWKPSLEERARFEVALREAHASKSADMPRNMQIAGSTAEIAIDGVLTEKPNCLAMLFGPGNTTYESIRKGLQLAESDTAIKDVVLRISSPGGTVEGLFETFAVLESMTKAVKVVASEAASAAFGLAAVAGPIEPVSPASSFGSIGVAVRMHLDKDAIDIASTEAPNKRPDVTTDEGKAVIREELDAIHDLFVDSIARGRSATTGDDVTAKQVNAEFGRGGMFLAAEAKKRGMIDRGAPKRAKRANAGIRAENDSGEQVELPPMNASAATGGATTKETNMNKEELKKAHPELYASVLAEGVAEGVTQGSATERKRVTALMKLGKASGAMDVAEKAIASGASPQDDEVFAEFQTASMNRRDQRAHQEDSDKAGDATKGAKPTEGKKSLIDKFADDLA